MNTERSFTRREFLIKTSVATSSLFIPEAKEQLENSARFYRDQGILGIYGANDLAPTNPIYVVHEQNQEIEKRSVPTPSITEGYSTSYLSGSNSLTSLKLLYDSLSKDSTLSPREQVIKIIGDAVFSDEMLKQINIDDPAFSDRYMQILNKLGIDLVLATKMPEDQGRLFEVEIWDRVNERWLPPQTGAVLDIANFETQQRREQESLVYENFKNTSGPDATKPAVLSWLSDISSEYVDIFNLPDSYKKTGVPIRLSEIFDYKSYYAKVLENTQFVYPEYRRLCTIDQFYQQLAYNIRVHLQDPNFASSFKTFATQTKSPDILFNYFTHYDDIPPLAAINFQDFADQVQGDIPADEKGFPQGNLFQQKLFMTLADAKAFEKNIITTNHASEPNQNGVFFVERYSDIYGSQTNEGQLYGIKITDKSLPLYIYYDANSSQLSQTSNPFDLISISVQNNAGQSEKETRIVIYS
jgi:hypothetical protein